MNAYLFQSNKKSVQFIYNFIVSNYFFKKAKNTIEFMGKDIQSLYQFPKDTGIEDEYEEEPDENIKSTDFDDFQEYDIREEPNFDMKNYLYTTDSNSHYKKRKELRQRFGTGVFEEGEFVKDSHSDLSESSISQFDNFKKDNLNL